MGARGPIALSMAIALLAFSLACADAEPPATVATVPALRAESCRQLGDQPLAVTATSPAARIADAIAASPDGIILPTEVAPLGGFVLHDSALFVFDLPLSRIVRLDERFEIAGRIGREGRGPGEFRLGPGTRVADFLAVVGDTLVAFDGATVQWFGVAGSFMRGQRIPDATRSFLTEPERLRVVDGQVFVESMSGLVREGGRLVATPDRQFTVWRVVGDSAHPVDRVTLPQLPRAGAGGFFGSPAEARPVWDIREGCLVLADGNSPGLLLRDLRTGAADTLTMPLPERFADPVEANKNLPGMSPDFVAPPPALLGRVLDMILAPDGWLWMRPVQPQPTLPDGSVEVWKYGLRTGQFVIDTVSGMPRVFDAAGRGIGTRMDDEGDWHLIPLPRKD